MQLLSRMTASPLKNASGLPEEKANPNGGTVFPVFP